MNELNHLKYLIMNTSKKEIKVTKKKKKIRL